MYLSKIEIFGFKSFADRTEFNLRPGVTGIVGPNGCGKSNVVDALKWVLGEQSAKSLRGTEMMDVIFSGAGTRKPLGMAEVTLTFSEVQGVLPVDQEEVSVTRRLFRSGESEYLLNRQTCRLKDIRELFMDTGIGKEAYSVIEQGKIDFLLQSNAEQRRAIFEEAAGISRYKAKRKETERRLERIDANYQRLCDITEEVEKQIRSVKVQAGRARRYRELLDEWKDRRLLLAGAQRRILGSDRARIEESLRCLREEEALVSARVSSLEADLTVAEETLSRLQEDLLEVQRQVARVESGIDSERERARMESQRAEESAAEAHRLRGEANQHRSRIREIIGDLREKEARQREIRGELERVVEAIRAGVDREQDLIRRLHALRTEAEERRSRHMDALARQAEARNRKVSLESNLESLARRLDRKREDASRLEAQRQALTARRAEEFRGMQGVQEEMERRETLLDAQNECRTGIEARQAKQAADRARVERRLEAVVSSLGVLVGVRSQMVGVQEGVKSLLSVDGNGGFPGLGRMIADSLEVDLRYARALEAALGGKAQAILAEGTSTAVDAIRFLKAEERGRASLVPMDYRAQNGTEPEMRGPGIVGPASSVVRCPETLQGLVDVLLGHTWIVEDLHTALHMSRNGGSGETFVTLDGDRIDPNGLITGGQGENSGGLILNRSQMRALEEEREDLTWRLEEIGILEGKTLAVLVGLVGRIQKEEAALRECREAADDAEEEMRRIDQSLATVDERHKLDQMEIEELLREKDHEEERLEEAEVDLLRVSEEASTLEEEAARSKEERETARREKDDLSAELSGLRITEAQIREKGNALRSAREDLLRGLADRRESRSLAREGVRDALRRSADARRAAGEANRKLADLVERQADLQGQAVRISEDRDARTETIQALREEAKATASTAEGIASEIQEIRLQENQTILRAEQLASQAREEFGVPVEELPEPGEDWNEEEERDRVTELRQKIDRMGNVNLEALDQLAELEERHVFLLAQKKDLERAKRSLQEVMRRIARTCRERFSETFQTVRGHFQEIFRKLFGGGRADVYLQEAEDELEAGVEIVARPPGKEPRHITLLSGGEKALTTIALLFAIFRSRPSPFCILDEVDAPLDESNINRFVMLLQEFLAHSQFLIITHSKPTMAVADDLYGVTQEEQGVSKRIAVHFEEIERQVA